MKILLILIAILSLALTPAEKAIVEHIRELNVRQKVELDDTKAKLVWTYKELSDKEPQIAQLGKERDQWKSYGEKEHESNLTKSSKILKLYITIGVMGLAIGLYAFAKFYLRVPFL